MFSVRQITDGVKPTLSELEKFEDQPEGIDLEVVTESGQCGADSSGLCPRSHLVFGQVDGLHGNCIMFPAEQAKATLISSETNNDWSSFDPEPNPVRHT